MNFQITANDEFKERLNQVPGSLEELPTPAQLGQSLYDLAWTDLQGYVLLIAGIMAIKVLVSGFAGSSR